MGFDTVVIGGGVMGCAVALRLADAGQRVLVLEKAVPGAEASSAAGGILAPQAEAAHGDGPLFRLCLASRALYPAFAAELLDRAGIELGFRACGLLFVAHDDAGEAKLTKDAAWQASLGLRAEKLDGDAARSLEPSLAPAVRAALHLPDEAQVDAQRLAQALPTAVRRAGVEVRRSVVAGVFAENGRVRGVELEDGRIESDAVVIAAGAWSAAIHGTGLPAGAIRPMRGQMVRLQAGDDLPRRVVFTSGGYVVPRADGTVLCGSTQELCGFDKRVTAGGVQAILTAAIGAFPALTSAALVESWAGFRPYPIDGHPLLGELPTRGLFLASGHHRNGILLTPKTAELIAAAVLGNASAELAPFSPARFFA